MSMLKRLSRYHKKKKIRIAKSTRELMEQHGIETAQVNGSGSGGNILKADVLAVIDKLKQAVTMQDQPPVGNDTEDKAGEEEEE